MGIPIMVMGESGSGKTTSLRNFSANEVYIFNVAGKPLPFRGELHTCENASYEDITNALQNAAYKTYIIDDSQYLMCFELFDKCKDTGYGKFTDAAKHFYDLLQFIIRKTPSDCVVYFLHHVEATDGRIKAKTSGKMLDSQLTLEGLFSVVLMCVTNGKEYKFVTQSDGTSTAKSPMGMFPAMVDNDLKAVDETIRAYWHLTPGAELPRCEVCGGVITATAKKTVAEIIAGTQKIMGKAACADCCKKWVKDHAAPTLSD